MKHVIKFNLPEEEDSLRLAMKGRDMSCVLSGFYEILRSKLKYEELTDTEEKALEELKEQFFELVNEYDVQDCF